MSVHKQTRVLTVQTKCLTYPQLCGEVYASGIKPNSEVPFCVATIPIVLRSPFARRGTLAGILVTYVLPEAAASLYIVIAGSAHVYGQEFNPLRPYYYESGYSRESIEFLHSQRTDVEDNLFMWPCYCFRGKPFPLASLHKAFQASKSTYISPLLKGRVVFYGVSPTLNMTETIRDIYLKPMPQLRISHNIPVLQLSVILINKSVQPLQLVPLSVLVSTYKDWIVQVLQPYHRNILHLSALSYASSYLKNESSSLKISPGTLSNTTLEEILVTRFYPAELLFTQQNHFGNELFVFFSPVHNYACEMSFLRQACVFPGRGITYGETGAGACTTVGSFYVHEILPHPLGVVRLGFEHYESAEEGVITYVGLAKTIPPYTGSGPPIEFGLAVVHVYAAPDSDPSVAASTANYRYIRTHNIRDPFTYMSNAFHLPFSLRINSDPEQEPKLFHTTHDKLFLELHRPLYGSHSGGFFFLFKLSKVCKAVSIALPFFTGHLQPPDRTFPQHKSQTTYYPLYSTGLVIGYSTLPFLAADVAVSTLNSASSIKVNLQQFALECVESITHKQHDRLVFSAIFHRILPRAFSLYCLDFGESCVPRKPGAPESQPYSNCAIYRLSCQRPSSDPIAASEDVVCCSFHRRTGNSGEYRETLSFPNPLLNIAQIGGSMIQWGVTQPKLIDASFTQTDADTTLLKTYFFIIPRPLLHDYTVRTTPNYYILIANDILFHLSQIEPDTLQQHRLQLFLDVYLKNVSPKAEFNKGALPASVAKYLLSIHSFSLQDDGTMRLYAKEK